MTSALDKSNTTVKFPARVWRVVGDIARDYGLKYGGFDPLNQDWAKYLAETRQGNTDTHYLSMAEVDAAVRAKYSPTEHCRTAAPTQMRIDFWYGNHWLRHEAQVASVSWSLVARVSWSIRPDESGIVVRGKVATDRGVVLEAEYAILLCDKNRIPVCPDHVANDDIYFLVVAGRTNSQSGAIYHEWHCRYLAKDVVAPLVKYSLDAVRNWANGKGFTTGDVLHDDSTECHFQAYESACDEVAILQDREQAAKAAWLEAKTKLEDFVSELLPSEN